MKTRQQINDIKGNTERTIQGLRTKSGEFVFEDNERPVKSDVIYSVYYTLDKEEIYLTGITSSTNSKEIIKIKDKTAFSSYADLGSNVRQPYPKPKAANPSDSDYRIGEIKRYFTRIANDPSKPIYEISKQDFQNQNNLYKYIEINWVISGLKSKVEETNAVTILSLENEYVGIVNVLFPLQLWKPTQNSPDDLKNKLKRLKK